MRLTGEGEFQPVIIPEDLRDLPVLEYTDLHLVYGYILGKRRSVALGCPDHRRREGIDERIVVEPQGLLFRHGLRPGDSVASPHQARNRQDRDG